MVADLWQSIGYFSNYCNSTIEVGIETTPLLRRIVKRATRITTSGLLSEMSPLVLAGTVFCSITAVLLGLIFTRPRMQPFATLISNVRLELTKWIPGVRCIRCAPGSRVTAETLLLLEEELCKKQKELFGTSHWTGDLADYIILSEYTEEFNGEWLCDGSVEEDPGPSVLSSASEEMLPKVQMAESLLDARSRGDRTQIYALHGLGGVGKTQLSVEFARKHRQEYSAVFWLDARSDNGLQRSIVAHLAGLHDGIELQDIKLLENREARRFVWIEKPNRSLAPKESRRAFLRQYRRSQRVNFR